MLRKQFPRPTEIDDYALYRLGFDEVDQLCMPFRLRTSLLQTDSIVRMNERKLLAKSIAIELAAILAGRVM